MYIKRVRKSSRRSKRAYEYLHLVENVRTENGPRQRLILNLGNIDVPPEQHKDLANCIEAMLTGQQHLLSADPHINRLARKAADKIRTKQAVDQQMERTGASPPTYQLLDAASIEASQVRSLGPEYVCHCAWNELGLNELLISQGVPEPVLPLMEALVIGRLVSPGSETHTWQWAECRSALYELTGHPLRASINSMYRAGDRLLDCKDTLERHLADRERDLFGLPERIFLFDLTNMPGGGRAAADSEVDRGRCKAKRAGRGLPALALVVDELGFAKYSCLYSDNQAEWGTLHQIFECLQALRPGRAGDRAVVIDASMATEDNVAFLKEHGVHYIVVEEAEADSIADGGQTIAGVRHADPCKLEVKRRQPENEAWLLCRSAGPADGGRGMICRQEDLLVERLQSYREGLSKKGCTKLYSGVVGMIARLRAKYPQAAERYDIEVIPDGMPGKKVNAKAIVWKRRVQREARCRFEGRCVLRTDLTAWTDQRIQEIQAMLARLQSALRLLNAAPGLRPDPQQKEARIDAHLFISVLAYHLMQAIEYRLRLSAEYRSWGAVRGILSTHRRLTVEYNVQADQKIQRSHLRLCSNVEPEHRQIYQCLGLQEPPLPRRLWA